MLDNARYRRNSVVQALAAEPGIMLLFLPSYSPNPSLIERPRKFVKRKSRYDCHHASFAGFRAAIETMLGQLPTLYAPHLATPTATNFQEFDKVSLLAA